MSSEVVKSCFLPYFVILLMLSDYMTEFSISFPGEGWGEVYGKSETIRNIKEYRA